METPADLGPRGVALWASLTETFDLAPQEAELLHEAARVADRLDALDAIVRDEGVTVTTPQGVKAHPALVEARQQGLTLSRLVAALRIPDADDEDDDAPKRPQRRGGARGHYASSRAYGSLSVAR
jgi:hypothetical protein